MAKGKTKRKKKSAGKRSRKPSRPRCGLCGKTTNLTKTECCDQWICDDEDQYVLFSYARSSCYRNHRSYTLCGHHYDEGHPGDWKDCPKCREDIKTEMYVYYGTNEYNFEILENPPDYEPTQCSKCGAVIVLSEGGYSLGSEGYRCGRCTAAEFPDVFRPR
jgi:ribosomal protein S27AE